MRYMIGVFISLLFISSAHAAWSPLTIDGEWLSPPHWFFYMDEAKKKDGLFTIRILQSSAYENVPRSASWLVTIDCKNKTEKDTESYEYTMHMGKGLGRKKEDIDFHPIKSSGYSHLLWIAYCK